MLQGFLPGEPCKFTDDGVTHSKDCITLEIRYAPTNKVPLLNEDEWPVPIFRATSCSIRLMEAFSERTRF